LKRSIRPDSKSQSDLNEMNDEEGDLVDDGEFNDAYTNDNAGIDVENVRIKKEAKSKKPHSSQHKPNLNESNFSSSSSPTPSSPTTSNQSSLPSPIESGHCKQKPNKYHDNSQNSKKCKKQKVSANNDSNTKHQTNQNHQYQMTKYNTNDSTNAVSASNISLGVSTLKRLFPNTKSSYLEKVLYSCNGDLIFASQQLSAEVKPVGNNISNQSSSQNYRNQQSPIPQQNYNQHLLSMANPSSPSENMKSYQSALMSTLANNGSPSNSPGNAYNHQYQQPHYSNQASYNIRQHPRPT